MVQSPTPDTEGSATVQPRVSVEEIEPDSVEATWCLDRYYRELGTLFKGGFDPARSLLTDPADMRRPQGVFLLARLDGEPVGCGVVMLTTPGVGYIKRMWVDPARRGRGLGRRMLGALEQAALDLGCNRVQLETNRALTGAISLYRSAGYRDVAPFNDEHYAHHWFEKTLSGASSGRKPAPPEPAVAAPPTTLDIYLAQARSALTRLDPADAHTAMQRGAILVDIRPEFQRRRDGEVPGAIVVERNHLEWRLHPESPARIPEAIALDVQWIVFCDEGYASSLAAAALHELGLRRATDVIGGLRAWRAAGMPLGLPGHVSAPRLAPEPE